jgi:hypothetical protein
MNQTEQKYSDNKTKDQIADILCIECHRITKHRVAASLDKDGSVSNDQLGWSVEWSDHYQVIQCKGCESVTFRHLHWFSEDCHPEIDEDGTTERLYPKRDSNTIKARPLLNVPTRLKRLYSEVIDCFNYDAFTLCAAGLRALVEGLCADQAIVNGPVSVLQNDGSEKTIRKNNLEGKISGLCEKGLLTQANAEMLHQLRFLGNEAVHELARPPQSELKLAIEIVEHVFEQLYEIPQKKKAIDLRCSMANRANKAM